MTGLQPDLTAGLQQCSVPDRSEMKLQRWEAYDGTPAEGVTRRGNAGSR